MATPHISAPDGAFAKTVLMPGDPLRAKFIADTFLTDAKLVTDVRNVLGYTGTYRDVPVSVMASGMGMPSIGIYSYELYKFYGVENIIRIGSAGSYRDWLKVMDVTLAERAVSESTFAKVQGGVTANSLHPSEELNELIRQKAEDLNIGLKMSVVHSSDVFYSDPSQGTWEDIAERTDTDCVEMESFALFHNANMLGKRAACLLTISDSFVSHVELTSEQRQNSFTEMMKLALETAIAIGLGLKVKS
ncbi:MAG: purine-nucleoside phosphorylase [Bacteroidaceae bacterium]|nr:purine-nucleoside phosphorylase [Bacteroidaceae bacterium]